MYEQLQDILNKCIEKGWKPRGSDNIIRIEYRNYNDYNAEFRMIKNGTPGEVSYIVGTHDLFSKDSGLMEFVELVEPTIKYEMIDSFAETDSTKNHYIIMSTMTAKEKVKYFIDNVII